jgi:hypothetical protein
MSRSREELYATTETYYDEVPQVVTETVSIPYQVANHMRWQVTWYTLTGDRKWGASVGTQTFDATFIYNWGSGPVFGGYSNYVGFAATSNFYVEEAGLFTFTLGSDDGSILKIDGTTVINQYYDGPYREQRKLWWGASGWHTAEIDYYQYINTARIYFDVDKGNLFTWEETQHMTVEIPRIQLQQVPKQRTTVANRTVTETVYESILEYLMKGGKP